MHLNTSKVNVLFVLRWPNTFSVKYCSMYFTCKSPVTRLIYCQPLNGTGTRDYNSLKVVWFDRSWFRESLEASHNLSLVPNAFELPKDGQNRRKLAPIDFQKWRMLLKKNCSSENIFGGFKNLLVWPWLLFKNRSVNVRIVKRAACEVRGFIPGTVMSQI